MPKKKARPLNIVAAECPAIDAEVAHQVVCIVRDANVPFDQQELDVAFAQVKSELRPIVGKAADELTVALFVFLDNTEQYSIAYSYLVHDELGS
jgi:hypothetical protein